VGRVVVVVPLKDDAHGDALGLLRDGPPMDLDMLKEYQAFLSSREAVIVLEGPGVGPDDGRPWDDLTAWRDGPRWRRCAASAPRIAESVHAWERAQDLEGVFFGPQPGPGDSEGGDAITGSASPRTGP
jgi:hypothetical protein